MFYKQNKNSATLQNIKNTYTHLMNYSFFTNSRKSWQAMYSALSKAQKAIYMEMYIFETRTEKFDFFTLLKEKARE